MLKKFTPSWNPQIAPPDLEDDHQRDKRALLIGYHPAVSYNGIIQMRLVINVEADLLQVDMSA